MRLALFALLLLSVSQAAAAAACKLGDPVAAAPHVRNASARFGWETAFALFIDDVPGRPRVSGPRFCHATVLRPTLSRSSPFVVWRT